MKLNKVLAGAALAMAFAATAPAQAQSFGIKGDINYTGNSASGAGYGLGFGAGGSMMMDFGAPVGLEVDLMYVRRVRTSEVALTNSDVDVTANTLHLPVQATFGLGPVMMTAGGYMSYVLGDLDVDGNSVEPANSMDFGLVLGLGAMFEGVSVEGRFLLGLSDLSEDIAGNSIDSKTRAFDLLVGYYF